jgi:hypothetical protein
MIRKILKYFGYYKVDYGVFAGRRWLSIDGKTIAQTSGDIWLRDEDIHRIVYETIDNGEHWSEPSCWCTSECCNPGWKWCERRRGVQ